MFDVSSGVCFLLFVQGRITCLFPFLFLSTKWMSKFRRSVLLYTSTMSSAAYERLVRVEVDRKQHVKPHVHLSLDLSCKIWNIPSYEISCWRRSRNICSDTLGRNRGTRLGDHKSIHVQRPGIEPGPHLWESRALIIEPVAQLFGHNVRVTSQKLMFGKIQCVLIRYNKYSPFFIFTNLVITH